MKQITIKPSSGGRLMSDLSAGSVGITNYTIKRDWRRLLDREIRAEGHVKFAPNPSETEASQAYPPGVDSAIELIAEATLANGSIALVVGTRTKLWAYYGLFNGGYVSDIGGVPYVEAGYFDNNPGDWVLIGSGSGGNRWEAVQVGSWLVLNNGVDLPMTYRVGDSAVIPMWELREAGIASVGTIAELDGILCCFDIRQIPDDVMEAISSSTGAAVNGAVAGSIKSTTNNPMPIFGAGSPIFGGGVGIFGN